MKIVYCILYIVLLAAAFAITGDFDGNGEVWVPDAVLFAEDWLLAEPNVLTCDIDDSGAVDFVDFALFAEHFKEGYANRAPVAAAVDVSATAGTAATITLSATDEDGTIAAYSFVTWPRKGLISATAAPGVYSYLPHWHESGQDLFSYRAFDGTSYSEPADVNVIITAATLDNVSFVRPASVTIPDGDTVNVDDSFMVCFWFKTYWPYGALLRKRAASGAGIEILIRAGQPVARLYDADNVCYTLTVRSKVNDGVWRFLGLSYKSDGGVEFNGDAANTACLMVGDEHLADAASYAVVPARDFSNTANVVFGRSGAMSYYGSIDAFSNYDTGKDSLVMAVIMIERREAVPTGLSPTYYRRFLINEGSGTTIHDVSESVTGTLQDSGRLLWTPPTFPTDRSFDKRSRLRNLEGIEMLPDGRKKQ